jgi:hypothetical protein
MGDVVLPWRAAQFRSMSRRHRRPDTVSHNQGKISPRVWEPGDLICRDFSGGFFDVIELGAFDLRRA